METDNVWVTRKETWQKYRMFVEDGEEKKESAVTKDRALLEIERN